MKILRLTVLLGVCLGLLVSGAAPAAAASAVLPVPGPVARGFDPPDRPWLSGHRGVDLRSPAGTPVRAALAGRVTFAAELAGRGVVVVSHGALRTTYEPVTARVSVGTMVGTGEVIGTLQAGHPCTGGDCLHWGLRRGEQYLNPLWLLDPGPIRLLPSSTIEEVSGPEPAWAELTPAGGPAGRPYGASPW